MTRRHKYNVSAREKRTYRGRVYDSQAEAVYANRLDMELRAGHILWWVRQVPVELTEDDCYHIDFLVQDAKSRAVHGVDVKGFETPGFKRNRRLWRKYGPFPLHIVRNGKTVEIVPGARE